VQFPDEPAAVADGAHALVVVTEWDEFRLLDWGAMRDLMAYPLLIDGRNMFNPDRMADLGFVYRGSGLSAGRAPGRSRGSGIAVAAARH
jgi:UDPglucose 6-dehydrogenase